MNPDTPSPSIDALLATAQSLGRRALICVSRRPNEVEAFSNAVARAGFCDAATVVYNEEMNEAKEGVPECLVFSFDFQLAPTTTGQKEMGSPNDIAQYFQ